MPRFQKRILFAMFFFSGFCSLLYQVVWMRMALASFGVITPVISVIISIFMLGLFVGSWLAGRWITALSHRIGLSAIWLYAFAEILIGISAFVVPELFATGESFLLGSGESDSFHYLIRSGLIIGISIFPWCFCMGATFPLMMAYVKERDFTETTSFSFLYLANVIGAMLGTLTTAVVLIELVGFRSTLHVAFALNFSVAAMAVAMGLRFPSSGASSHSLSTRTARTIVHAGKSSRLYLAILFTTGFTSMAMEVVWTRGFAAVLKTQVYSFAALLFVYLLATWIGSLWYRRHLRVGRVISTSQLAAWLGVTAFAPIAFNDPRLQLGATGALTSIFPFCALLGYLTPKLIDKNAAGSPDGAGFTYAVNISGCILGPLVASYLLLPFLGIKFSLMALALPFVFLFLLYYRSKTLQASRRRFAISLVFMGVVALSSLTYEDRTQNYHGNGVVRRDHTATVISYGDGMDKRLLVNGIGITHLTTITKLMAHLPLASLRSEPTSALVICFGMGTTYRSLLSWDILATGVELVPSVKDAFPYYFDDARKLMAKANGKIVIDDGRRFLRRTSESFDVITLDPPPPVEAAGSSLLYSEEFYSTAKHRLKPGGILQQWLPAAEERIVRAVTRSLLNSFAHVRMFRSHETDGHHFLASHSPIQILSAAELAHRLPDKAKVDLIEWANPKDAAFVFDQILRLEMDPRETVGNNTIRVTDDKPYNEYYLIRRAGQVLNPRKTSG